MSHLDRLQRESGTEDLLEALCERLSPTDLQSLLLEVYRRRCRNSKPSEVLKRYKESRFSKPAALNPRAVQTAKIRAYEVFEEDFVPVQLSPLAPLGTCSTVATCDQNKIVSTIRNLEVASDPTNALALECALRRRTQEESHLMTAQRVVRAQHFGEAENFYAHFELVGLVSSGRRGQSFAALHLDAILRFLSDLPRCPQGVVVALTPLDHRGEAALEEIISLQDDFLNCSVTVDRDRESGRGYYQKLCYKVYAEDLEIGDGGYTDWTSQLLGDRKEQCMISGLGLERIAQHFFAQD